MQQDMQRLGSLPSTPYSISHLENANGETLNYISEVEQEGSDRVQPIHLSPVF